MSDPKDETPEETAAVDKMMEDARRMGNDSPRREYMLNLYRTMPSFLRPAVKEPVSILDPRREPDDDDMPAPESTDKEGMWRLGWRAGWLAACNELAKITEGH
jgi:hypothetical protein